MEHTLWVEQRGGMVHRHKLSQLKPGPFLKSPPFGTSVIELILYDLISTVTRLMRHPPSRFHSVQAR